MVDVHAIWMITKENNVILSFLGRRVEMVMVDVHAIWMITKENNRAKKKNRSMRADELKSKHHQIT